MNGTLASDVSNLLILEYRKFKLTVLFACFVNFVSLCVCSASANLWFASPPLILCLFLHPSALVCNCLLLCFTGTDFVFVCVSFGSRV